MSKMSKMIGFQYGALCDKLEKQANEQGFTFGKDEKFVQMIHDGLVGAHIHGCITDGEYDKILRRFQQKVLIKRMKPLESEEI